MKSQLDRRLTVLEEAEAEKEIERYMDFWSTIPEADLELMAAGDPATSERYEPVFYSFSVETFYEAERRLWLELNDTSTGFAEFIDSLREE